MQQPPFQFYITQLNPLKIILASKSPRRSDLLQQMGLQFIVESRDVEENYSNELALEQVPIFLSEKKAHAFDGADEDSVIITADTIVICQNQLLGKPEDRDDAVRMLNILSGSIHTVITAVTIVFQGVMTTFSDKTDVYFRYLKQSEIEYYVDKFQPLDKAGSYGIQDWIGVNAIERIEGSYTNVVGLPTEKLYRKLLELGII